MKAGDLPLSRMDILLLGVVAAASLASVAYSAQEQVSWAQSQIGVISMDDRPSNLPASVRAWRAPLGLVLNCFEAGLMVAGTGLAILAIRPGRLQPRGRTGSGEIASTITALVLACYLIGTAVDRWVDSLVALPAGTSPGISPQSVMVWSTAGGDLGRGVPWIILSGWAYLVLSRQWRPARGRLDQLGRWVGWSWLGTRAMDGVMVLLAQL
jgi:hypothetical protein